MDYTNWMDLQAATGKFVTHQELGPLPFYDDSFEGFQLRDTFLYSINEAIDPTALLLSGTAGYVLPDSSEAVAVEEGWDREQSIQPPPCNTAGICTAQLQLDPPNMWEKHFDILLSLFTSFELKEIRKKMEESYGFYASIKQYKTQICQWQKEGRFPPKHIKHADMKAMASLQERRALDGKQTVFFYRGWRIDDLKIKRFISRFGVDPANTPAELPVYITSQTPHPREFYVSTSAEFTTVPGDSPYMRGQKRLNPQCSAASQVNTSTSSKEQIHASGDDSRDDYHKTLASRPDCVLTNGLEQENFDTILERRTATSGEWSPSQLDARNPSSMWPPLLSPTTSHMNSMKESYIEASPSSVPLLSRPLKDMISPCHKKDFVEPPHPSLNLPSINLEPPKLRKDVSNSFDIPSNSCFVDSEMLEPPQDTNSVTGEDDSETLEDCQTLVSCIFEFLQTTQPRRYELQAQLTIICEDLLGIIQAEKEKRIDMAVALKKAEVDRKNLMDEYQLLLIRKEALMNENQALMMRNKFLRNENRQLERRKTLQELAMSEVYSPTDSGISDVGRPCPTTLDAQSRRNM